MISENSISAFLINLGLDVQGLRLEYAPQGMGDIALPCFQFASALKKSPNDIAVELEKAFSPNETLERVQAVGPYLNFFLNKARAAAQLMEQTTISKAKQHGHIMVEFCSPNTNKPLHLGHLRNMAIGLSVSNLIESAGGNVIRACLVNDRGIHICKSMLAYMLWGEGKMPDKKSDHFVGDFYVMYSKKEDNTLAKKAHELLLRWEANDSEVRALWSKMNSWALEGFQETYERFGVKFARIYRESEIYDKGKELIEEGLKSGVFVEKDGAIVAEFSDMPDKVVMRKDGTSLYITQDIFLAMQKFRDYNINQSIYVVGSEQNLHFKQLFAILGKLGFQHAGDCRHLSYGMVNLPDGRMKSREGAVVDADDLLDYLSKLAYGEVTKRHSLNEQEVRERAELIAVGAIKFYLLKHDMAKDMTYDPKASISFDGETGPYVMYTYARISSIIRKYRGELPNTADFTSFTEADHVIVMLLSRYQETIHEAATALKPFVICHYLLKLSQAINEYYHKVPVLKADETLRVPRLILLNKAREIIKNGLMLLDIRTLEEM